jgi:hypothetical protein
MNALRIYAPPTVLVTGAGLVALVLLSGIFALGAAYDDLRHSREILADLQQRAAVLEDLKTTIDRARISDPADSGFMTASDPQQMNARFQQDVSEAVVAERGQLLSVNASEPSEKNGVLLLRVDVTISLPRDRLEALIGTLESNDTPIFFDNLRLDARQSKESGMVQIQAQLRVFGLIAMVP